MPMAGDVPEVFLLEPFEVVYIAKSKPPQVPYKSLPGDPLLTCGSSAA